MLETAQLYTTKDDERSFLVPESEQDQFRGEMKDTPAQPVYRFRSGERQFQVPAQDLAAFQKEMQGERVEPVNVYVEKESGRRFAVPESEDKSFKIEMGVEKPEPERNFLMDNLKGLAAGTARTVGGFLESAKPLLDLNQAYQEKILGLMPMPEEIKTQAKEQAQQQKEGLQRMPLGKMAIDQGKKLSPSEQFDKSILGYYAAADFGNAAKKLWLGLVENAPQLGLSAAAVASGNPQAALTILGSSAAGGKYNELQSNPDLTDTEKAGNALLTGAAEAASEMVTLGWMKRLMNTPGGRQAAKATITTMFNKLLPMAEEGGSEAAAQIAENLIDRAYGVKGPDGKLPNWYDNIGDPAIIGAASGGGGVLLNSVFNRPAGQQAGARGQAQQQDQKQGRDVPPSPPPPGADNAGGQQEQGQEQQQGQGPFAGQDSERREGPQAGADERQAPPPAKQHPMHGAALDIARAVFTDIPKPQLNEADLPQAPGQVAGQEQVRGIPEAGSNRRVIRTQAPDAGPSGMPLTGEPFVTPPVGSTPAMQGVGEFEDDSWGRIRKQDDNYNTIREAVRELGGIKQFKGKENRGENRQIPLVFQAGKGRGQTLDQMVEELRNHPGVAIPDDWDQWDLLEALKGGRGKHVTQDEYYRGKQKSEEDAKLNDIRQDRDNRTFNEKDIPVTEDPQQPILMRKGGEWYAVVESDSWAADKQLVDGETIPIMEQEQASGIVGPGNHGYEQALNEYRAQEQRHMGMFNDFAQALKDAGGVTANGAVSFDAVQDVADKMSAGEMRLVLNWLNRIAPESQQAAATRELLRAVYDLRRGEDVDYEPNVQNAVANADQENNVPVGPQEGPQAPVQLQGMPEGRDSDQGQAAGRGAAVQGGKPHESTDGIRREINKWITGGKVIVSKSSAVWGPTELKSSDGKVEVRIIAGPDGFGKQNAGESRHELVIDGKAVLRTDWEAGSGIPDNILVEFERAVREGDRYVYKGEPEGHAISELNISQPGGAEKGAAPAGQSAIESEITDALKLMEQQPAPTDPREYAARRHLMRRGQELVEEYQSIEAPTQQDVDNTRVKWMQEVDRANKFREEARRPAQGKQTDAFQQDDDLFASPGYGSAGTANGAGQPGAPFDAADNPNYSAFPIEFPEMVEIVQELSGGRVPKLMDKLRALKGMAAGYFRADPDTPEIALRKDLFRLVSRSEAAKMKAQAAQYAATWKQENPKSDIAEQQVADEKFKSDFAKLHTERLKQNPIQASKVLAHEIGHWIDWLPEKLLKRGNILGHIAAMKNYTDKLIPEAPDKWDTMLTEQDRQRLRAEAQAELEQQSVDEIVREITSEVPIFEESGIKPNDILAVWNDVERAQQNKELYQFIQKLDTQQKKRIVKHAMRGLVDDMLNQFKTREQIGTETITERVVEQQQKKVTKKNVEKLFKQKLQEEIQKRNLFEKNVVYDELSRLIAWWNGTPEMPVYYKKPAEMYADAFSVIINNPVAVAKKAPNFYKAWVNYLAARPDFKQQYDAYQKRIRDGRVQEDRDRRIMDMFHANDDYADRLTEALNKMNPRKKLDLFMMAVDRQYHPLHRRIKAGQKVAPDAADQVDESLRDWLYHQSRNRLYAARMANDVIGPMLQEKGVPLDEFNLYLFNRHIYENRQDIASSLGMNPASASKSMEDQRRRLGDAAMDAMQQAEAERWKLRNEMVFDKLEQSGMLSQETLQLLRDRDAYSTVAAIHSERDITDEIFRRLAGSDIGPQIYRAEGTLTGQKSPLLATMQKDISLMTSVEMNNLKRDMHKLLKEMGDPQFRELEADEYVFDPATGRRLPKISRNPQIRTITYMDRGKVVGYHAPKEMADMIDRQDPADTQFMLKTLYMFNHAIKSMYTGMNYGFWPFNYIRDRVGFESKMPEVYGQFFGKNAYGNYSKRAREAARSLVKGSPNADARRAMERGMVITVRDRVGYDESQQAIERLLLQYEIDPQQFGIKLAKNAPADKIKQAARKIWQKYKGVGEMLEAELKIAGMLHLDQTQPDMSENDKKRMVQEYAGSPNFLEKGTGNSWIDLVIPFYNPAKQGMRSAYHALKENPGAMTRAALKYVVAPTLLQAALSNGWLKGILPDDWSEELEKMMLSVSDYDKSNYYIIPLGWDDEASRKVRYLRLPKTEEWRTIGGVMWRIISGQGNLRDLVNFAGGQLPGLSPLINVGLKAGELFAGNQPRDRGYPIVSETEIEAGKGWGTYAKWAASQLGASIIWRIQTDTLTQPELTKLQKTLNAPIISNTLGRFLKSSNRGYLDALNHHLKPLQRAEAEARLKAYNMVLAESKGEAPNAADHKARQEGYIYYKATGGDIAPLVLTDQEAYLKAYIAKKYVDYRRQQLESGQLPEIRAYMNASRTERFKLMEIMNK